MMTTTVTPPRSIVVLGVNGHVGRPVAEAFLAAGWQVYGFGRSLRKPLPGLTFIKGDADNLADLQNAVGHAAVVFNGLNLRYDQWDKGRMEAQHARVIEAIGKASGRTVLFPASIYNYAATERVITPATPRRPETPRGDIRERSENLYRAAAARGDLQFVLLRGGDYFGPGTMGDWFDLVMLRDIAKGRFNVIGTPGIGHSWAYLPDLARAFVKLAEARGTFASAEHFHFAGHHITPAELRAAMRAALGPAPRETPFPWLMLQAFGLVNGVVRGVLRMRYLWENPMRLEDTRLAALLGADFGTPLATAVASRIADFQPQSTRQAA